MAYEFLPTQEIDWQLVDHFGKPLHFSNDPGQAVVIEVPEVPVDYPFWWGPTGRSTIAGGGSTDITVSPPPIGFGPVKGVLEINVRDLSGNLVETRQIALDNNSVNALTIGDLGISTLAFNPPGDDLAGEGEFLDITNRTQRDLNLTGVQITQRTFNATTAPGVETPLVTFTPDGKRSDFGRNCVLAAGATLRVLTREARGNEGASSTRFFLNRGSAVWNNTGDRASIYGDRGADLLASFGYGSQALKGANFPDPAGVVDAPPRTIFDRMLPIAAGTFAKDNFLRVIDLEDGDIVTITTNEASLRSTFLAGGTLPAGSTAQFTSGTTDSRLPSGAQLDQNIFGQRNINPPTIAGGSDNPLPGGPWGALLFSFGLIAPDNSIVSWTQPQTVNDGVPFRVTLDRSKALLLIINDDNTWDNSGGYLPVVKVDR